MGMIGEDFRFATGEESGNFIVQAGTQVFYFGTGWSLPEAIIIRPNGASFLADAEVMGTRLRDDETLHFASQYVREQYVTRHNMGPTSEPETPQFTHGHDCCKFLGRFAGVPGGNPPCDLYFCDRVFRTVIARYSDKPSDNQSGWFAEGIPELIEAKRRAVEMGLASS